MQVSDAALYALRDVAVAIGCKCTYDSEDLIVQLLRENMDYVVDAVASRMRHLHEHPQTPSVLAAVRHVIFTWLAQTLCNDDSLLAVYFLVHG